MRQHLLTTFGAIRVLDLHGNMKKKEVAQDGSPDQNVFDIQQGVCVGLLARNPADEAGVAFSEILGSRELKYSALGSENERDLKWRVLRPQPQFYLFRPENASLKEEYYTFIPLPVAMGVNGDPAPGIVTTH